MLKKEDFFSFGKFMKPHGIKGEIGLYSESYSPGDGCDYIVCEIDGILVPFFVEYIREKNKDTVIVKFERINSDKDVRFLTNSIAYLPKEWLDDEDDEELPTWDSLTGYTISDNKKGDIGTIVDIESSTINTLFIIDNGEKEIMIPAHEEFILSIDKKHKTINVSLPDGLTDL